jgi:hypothetical protein
MPQAKDPALLASVYAATRSLLDKREIPTRPLERFQTVFRSIPLTFIKKPLPGAFISAVEERNAISPFDQQTDRNRWSGISHAPNIPAAGGLYCVLQQQALVNEVMHYHRGQKGPLTPFDPASFADKVVAQFYLKNSILALDLSNSNPATQQFYAKLLPQLSQNRLQIHQMLSADDCSIPRAIGLAVAQCSYLHALIVPTMRFSDRSPYERGDNVVFFGPNQQPIPHLVVEKITFP